MVLFLFVFCVLFVPLAFELYLHLTSNYEDPIGYVFHAKVGFLYDHKTCPDKVNSFGFVDKPRDVSGNKKKKILLVGDSFVSGTSLARHLEDDLNKSVHGEQVEVIPMGFPGIGLGNMYAFVKEIGSQFHPVAVVAVFNSSTFANDSRVLEAIKLRGHPDHPMGLFFEERNGECVQISADSNFKEYVLKESPSENRHTLYTVLESGLEKIFGRFYAYNWLKDIVAQGGDKNFLGMDREFSYRYYQIKSMPAYAGLLAGWSFPDDLDMNSMFWVATETMPPVFKSALSATKCALLAFNQLAEARDFKFFLAISDDCSVRNNLLQQEFRFRSKPTGRVFLAKEYKNKIVLLAKETRTHFIDLNDSFGDDPLRLHKYNDIHWNENGFRQAAASVSSFLLEQPDFIEKISSENAQ
ncbi:hypothetical protein [Solidesulfovibrio fructosivorans]|uniref:hypothetical protein n=1 Tax=Solidesulfovibrio fructosivorans TaxID=878 RepID=UPI00117E52E5|nr:hypothetical protein [Solidesulfovibrio fructosivorans]